ncbi:MAG: multidrug transporter [Marmoricola sp.]|jgi:drug/metabolite transporter (DMT)-like permease|nr:multidrug transporter [Marmoricola sp.]
MALVSTGSTTGDGSPGDRVLVTPKAWLPIGAAGVTLLLWASAFVAVRHLGRTVTPGALSLGRLLVAGTALSVLLSTRKRTRLTRNDVLLLLLCGVTWFGVYNLALNEAERRIDAATAAMLVQIGPILVALLAALFLGEKLTAWLLVGIGVAFTGVVVIGLALSEGGSSDVVGVLLTLLAASTYAVGVVCQKPLLRRLSPLEVICYACIIGAVVCLPWTGDLVQSVQHVDTSTILLVIYLGLFPTALAFTTWAFALSHTGASNLSVTTFLVPLITTLLAWLLLDEVPPGAVYLGGALCVAGVLLSRRKPRTREIVCEPG